MATPDHDHLTAMWARHADDVYAYARRRIGPTSAPDVVAEVFTIAIAHPDRLPPDPLPWLYRTAWNVIANTRRADIRRTETWAALAREATALSDDPGTVVSDRAALLEALKTLSEDDREALLLTTWEGLDARRAAHAAGCSTATFSVRLHRARRRLERALDDTPIATEEVTP